MSRYVMIKLQICYHSVTSSIQIWSFEACLLIINDPALIPLSALIKTKYFWKPRFVKLTWLVFVVTRQAPVPRWPGGGDQIAGGLSSGPAQPGLARPQLIKPHQADFTREISNVQPIHIN